MKKYIILFIIFFLALIGYVYANITVSIPYSTKEQCSKVREKNSKKYPNYKRSNCYLTNAGYVYSICEKNTEICSKIQQPNNKNFLPECNITGDFKYINQNIKIKVDKVISLINEKLKNNSNIVNAYIYGFYDYNLSRIKNIKKYKNNVAIQELIVYLSKKFKCLFKKLNKNSINNGVDLFLKEILLGEKHPISNNNLKQFILFMIEKGINKTLLEKYITNYPLIPSNEKELLLQELNNVTNKYPTNSNILTKNEKIFNNIKISANYIENFCKKNGYNNWKALEVNNKNCFQGPCTSIITKVKCYNKINFNSSTSANNNNNYNPRTQNQTTTYSTMKVGGYCPSGTAWNGTKCIQAPKGFKGNITDININNNLSKKDKKNIINNQKKWNSSISNPHNYNSLGSYYKANPNAGPCFSCYNMK